VNKTPLRFCLTLVNYLLWKMTSSSTRHFTKRDSNSHQAKGIGEEPRIPPAIDLVEHIVRNTDACLAVVEIGQDLRYDYLSMLVVTSMIRGSSGVSTVDNCVRRLSLALEYLLGRQRMMAWTRYFSVY
jgi:hypothetical protein